MEAAPKDKAKAAGKLAVVPEGAAKAKTKASPEGKVIYIGHIPHGFYEDQMTGFFSQFGDVTRVRVSRNPKSGHSRHYGWVEFKHPAVARVAAEAMDNYLMFGQVLRVRVVPPAQVHPSTFKGAGRPVRPRPGARLAREAHNAKRSEEQLQRAAGRLLRGERKRRGKIAAAGIEYDFAGYAAAAPPAAEAKAPKAAPPAKEKAEVKEKAAPAAKGKRGAAAEATEAPTAPPPPAKRAKAAAAPAAEPDAPAARPRRSARA